MAASTLSALDYDYTLGQEITLFIEPLVSEGELPPEPVMKTFTLCGIVREYHSLWCIGARSANQIVVSAFITPEGGNAIQEATGHPPLLQLFLDVDKENWDSLQEWFKKEVGVGFYANNVFLNRPAYPDLVQTVAPDSFYIGLIGLISLVAVFSVFFLQMRESYHSYAVCRSIGMTKKQLDLLLTIETLFLAMPAVVLGTILGCGLTYLALQLMLYSGSAPIQVNIPVDTLATVIILWVICTIACRLALFFIDFIDGNRLITSRKSL